MSQQMSDNLIYNDKNYKLKTATLVDLLSGDVGRSSPLSPLLEANDMMQYFKSLHFHSANMRGYLCDWEIRDEKLFLTSFTSRSRMIHSIDQLVGKSPPALSAEYQNYQKVKKESETEFEKQYGSIDDLKKEMQKLRQLWEKEIVPKETKEAYQAMQEKCYLAYPDIFRDKDKANILADWFSGSIEVKEFDDYDGKINGLRIEISKGLVVGCTPCHVGNYYGRPLKNYIED